ncbi:phosphotransferase [Legionella lytica]|uniref:Phosphotransferase n=1 Tax=Legionella lytica TaxID=96232 RepID=A0ABY4Y5P4_9GAMM|nr:phosphotransferase family protein [Legionella lytica]USQ12895.1 phosphotransferase [Legionella lytica]
MKWLFFTSNTGVQYKLKTGLAAYILSFLDAESLHNLSTVSKEWNELVKLAQKYMSLLPQINEIPLFSQLTLDVLSFKLMAGGMTNATYKLTVGANYESEKRQRWVVRFPGDVSLFSVDRKHEQNNAQQTSDLKLNVPVAYFNGNSGVQVTEFIADVKPLDKTRLERVEILKALAEKAKILHQSKQFLNDTDVFSRNAGLLAALEEKEFPLPERVNFIANKMNELQNLFSAYQINKVPCHNDSTPLNYMLTDSEQGEVIYQIDWEYSSNNDFLWDLAYFAIEGKLSKKQEFIYLEAYFGEGLVSESVLAWYQAYKPVIEWWITLWSWMQLAFEATAVDLNEYAKLGEERYARTLEHLDGSEFAQAVELIELERTMAELPKPRAF